MKNVKNLKNRISGIKGFTLIELLVVIAIIGILSSVILASLNTARNKGSDAAATEDLNNIRAQAEIVYSNNNAYTNVCAVGGVGDANVIKGVAAAGSTEGVAWAGGTGTTPGTDVAGVGCTSTANAWAAWVALKSGTQWYCVDNTGTSILKTVVPTTPASVTACGTVVGAAW